MQWDISWNELYKTQFHRGFASKSFTPENEIAVGGKVAKERMTCLICVSAE